MDQWQCLSLMFLLHLFSEKGSLCPVMRLEFEAFCSCPEAPGKFPDLPESHLSNGNTLKIA